MKFAAAAARHICWTPALFNLALCKGHIFSRVACCVFRTCTVPGTTYYLAKSFCTTGIYFVVLLTHVRAQDISIDLTEKVRRCQGGKRLWKKMFQTVERIALEPGFSCN